LINNENINTGSRKEAAMKMRTRCVRIKFTASAPKSHRDTNLNSKKPRYTKTNHFSEIKINK
jgi:hypothetical protein